MSITVEELDLEAETAQRADNRGGTQEPIQRGVYDEVVKTAVQFDTSRVVCPRRRNVVYAPNGSAAFSA